METQGRIIKGVGGSYEVACDSEVYTCSAKGIFRNRGITPLIGDRVEFDVISERGRTGNVSRILERTNELKRPKVANIDQALIVFSIIRPVINFDLLDKFLILSEKEGVDAVVVLNKSDISGADEGAKLRRTYEDIGYKVVVMSALTQDGLGELRPQLSGKVSVLAGPSGVGKSSIVNCISQRSMETGELSRKIERGKHTTRHAELIRIDEDTFVVDSPGFTALATDELEPDEIAGCFREFRPFLGGCRFNDCKHLHEPDCAVKAQIGRAISQDRYERYRGLMP
ncbi:MAG: ribosome small subunit-dependent GTPase A [Defluviitaleaceae bacterium]|nr:ribosome small subunit-dependent GTPase A [Defluviitaleaceae bacterium]